eukprot:Sro1735_g294350.2  (497) ;mRNA; f:13905-15544
MSNNNQEGRKRGSEDITRSNDEGEEQAREVARRPRLGEQQADFAAQLQGFGGGGREALVGAAPGVGRQHLGGALLAAGLGGTGQAGQNQNMEQLLRQFMGSAQGQGGNVAGRPPPAGLGNLAQLLNQPQPAAIAQGLNFAHRPTLGGQRDLGLNLAANMQAGHPQQNASASNIFSQQFGNPRGAQMAAGNPANLSNQFSADLIAALTGARRPDPPVAQGGVGRVNPLLGGSNQQVNDFLSSLSGAAASQIPMVVASAAAGLRQQAGGQLHAPVAPPPLAPGLVNQLQWAGWSTGAGAAVGGVAADAAAGGGAEEEKEEQQPIGRRRVALYVTTDDESVNAYQCFARKQIELFEATQDDVDAGAQGRNKPIILGQVGIRCRHCSELHPRFRTRAAVYYPSRLAVLYQAAQNIVQVHLPQLCESIPDAVRDHLKTLDSKRSGVGGGKNYWCDTAKAQGITDTKHGLRYEDNPLPEDLAGDEEEEEGKEEAKEEARSSP